MSAARPRTVLDTNVLVSSLWGGHPGRVVRRWHRGALRVLMSPPILKEYLSVLGRFRPAEEDLDLLVALLGDARITEWVSPKERLHAIAEDPADNRFLECAVAGHADAIISGDRHLLRLAEFQAIPILPPRSFLQRWFPQDP